MFTKREVQTAVTCVKHSNYNKYTKENNCAAHMYGMQGGVVSERACLYARKDDELSIRAQYSFRPCKRYIHATGCILNMASTENTYK